jgi:hypothetical protein
LLSTLVVDVRIARPARLDFPAIRHGFAERSLYYMIAGLVFPDFFGEKVVDLKESYYAHRSWFFSLAFGAIVASLCKMVVLDGRLPPPMNLVFHGIFGLMLLIGAVTRSERYHKCAIVFGSALFVLYIILLYARMG